MGREGGRGGGVGGEEGGSVTQVKEEERNIIWS